MPKRNRLTNNSDETTISELISGDNIFAIPYFQRAYKWKPARLKDLNGDILALVDGSSDIHFFGAIIVHGHRSNPADPDIFDVIDGQQRITTIFLYLSAIIKVLSDNAQFEEAAGLFLKYLVISRDTKGESNFKLRPCKEDRQQLNSVFLDIIDNLEFKERLGGFSLTLLPRSGAENGTLLKNYRATLRFMKYELEQGGIDRIRAIYKALLDNISVVQIDVWDPTNGPKIFDSLNSKQEPMTIGDLVRNEVFSRVASKEIDIIEKVDAEFWQPFYKKFDQNGRNLFDSYFFPYGLIQEPNLRKSEVFNYLREKWEEKRKPEKIILELGEFQDDFIDILTGSNTCLHPRKAALQFKQLYLTKLPTSTFPFLMQLSKYLSLDEGKINSVVDILAVLETFLVRRAVCGHEPTGLHAVFKRLWKDCDGEITPKRVIREISKHTTVAWPDNGSFRDAIENRNLYGVNITPFVLLEFDKSLKGDSPVNVPWIEHVLPQKPQKKWFESFTKKEHLALHNRLANLIPLSSEMNKSVSNKPYDHKRKRFADDSMFKSARQFASHFKTWTPASLERRTKQMSNWAIRRWPYSE